MALEGLGAAVLGGGSDADVVATMHGVARCVCLRMCELNFAALLKAWLDYVRLTNRGSSLQRMLSIASDVHIPSGPTPAPSPPHPLSARCLKYVPPSPSACNLSRACAITAHSLKPFEQAPQRVILMPPCRHASGEAPPIPLHLQSLLF